ncbi:MAG: ribbon-helix-helix protein, CopG family [Chloroflexi bacterium]|jgi:hypothetical protein|nr:ribbon-helix-helix protein, CopG family [Chloroflexota bacterium]
MEKTTVYLPRALKRALEETARRRQVSEAELIREGVAAITRDEPPPQPTIPLFASGQPDLARNVEEALRGFGEG